jgi:hypothetical protein
MAALPPDTAPHVDWGVALGLGLGAVGLIASVLTHKVWRVVFGIVAWCILCATLVYATSAIVASLLARLVFVLVVSGIVGALALRPIQRFLKNSVVASGTSTSLKKEIGIFCQEVLEFVADRDALNPGSRLPHPMDKKDPAFTASTSEEFRRIQEDANRYTAQTIGLFNKKFAAKVRAYYGELRDRGIVDTALEAEMAYPVNTLIMGLIASRMGALSVRLDDREALERASTLEPARTNAQTLAQEITAFLSRRYVSHPQAGIKERLLRAKRQNDPMGVSMMNATLSSTNLEARSYDENTFDEYLTIYHPRVKATIYALNPKDADAALNVLIKGKPRNSDTIQAVAEYLRITSGAN